MLYADPQPSLPIAPPLIASPQLRAPSAKAKGLLPGQKFLIQLAPQPQVMSDAKPDVKYLDGFIPSFTFAGPKPGYVHKNGARGVGYYLLDDNESQREESEKPAGLYPRTMTPTARQWLATPVVPTAVATPVVPPPKSHAGKRVPPANWGSELRKETRGADGYAPGYPLHVRTCVGADGCPLQAHTRVQTQWTREKGRDDRWHAGSVSAVLASGEVTIKYDDGDEWTVDAMNVHLLNSAHPLKSGSCVEQIWDMVFKILGRTLGCLARENLLGPLLAMIMFVIPFLLCAFGDRRTGEIALWFKLDSCLSKTTPAFVYTLRAAAAAGARGGVPTPGLALALTHVLALA